MNAELESGRQRCRAVRERLEKALDGIGEEALNWVPEPGVWSVGEVVLHLNRTNGDYLGRIAEATEETRQRGARSEGPFRYGWLENWFVGQLEPANTRRLPAPKSFHPAPRSASRAEVDRLLSDLRTLERAHEEADGLDLTAVKKPSPVTPLLRFRLGTMLRLLVVHTDRHTHQIERVMNRPEYPKGEGA